MRETSRQAAQLDSFTSVSCFELQSYMVNTLLRDTDAVSMANSLEVRVPFLDHRLVEFVARLPKSAKYVPDVPKALLVEAFPTCCPKKSWVRPSEHSLFRGKSGSVARWACACRRILANLTPPLREYMNPRAVRGAWQNFVIGQTNWSRPWSLYVLNEWVRRHVTDSAGDPARLQKRFVPQPSATARTADLNVES